MDEMEYLARDNFESIRGGKLDEKVLWVILDHFLTDDSPPACFIDTSDVIDALGKAAGIVLMGVKRDSLRKGLRLMIKTAQSTRREAVRRGFDVSIPTVEMSDNIQ